MTSGEIPHSLIPLLLQVKNQAQVQTFASSTFSSFLDVLLSCFVFSALTLACFLPPLVSPATVGPPAAAALALAPLAGLLELASLVLSIRWGGFNRWHADGLCVFVWGVRTHVLNLTEINLLFLRLIKIYLCEVCYIKLSDHLYETKWKESNVFPRFYLSLGEWKSFSNLCCCCQCCTIKAQVYVSVYNFSKLTAVIFGWFKSCIFWDVQWHKIKKNPTDRPLRNITIIHWNQNKLLSVVIGPNTTWMWWINFPGQIMADSWPVLLWKTSIGSEMYTYNSKQKTPKLFTWSFQYSKCSRGGHDSGGRAVVHRSEGPFLMVNAP